MRGSSSLQWPLQLRDGYSPERVLFSRRPRVGASRRQINVCRAGRYRHTSGWTSVAAEALGLYAADEGTERVRSIGTWPTARACKGIEAVYPRLSERRHRRVQRHADEFVVRQARACRGLFVPKGATVAEVKSTLLVRWAWLPTLGSRVNEHTGCWHSASVPRRRTRFASICLCRCCSAAVQAISTATVSLEDSEELRVFTVAGAGREVALTHDQPVPLTLVLSRLSW